MYTNGDLFVTNEVMTSLLAFDAAHGEDIDGIKCPVLGRMIYIAFASANNYFI